jgi:hypothetical protein
MRGRIILNSGQCRHLTDTYDSRGKGLISPWSLVQIQSPPPASVRFGNLTHFSRIEATSRHATIVQSTHESTTTCPLVRPTIVTWSASFSICLAVKRLSLSVVTHAAHNG